MRKPATPTSIARKEALRGTSVTRAKFVAPKTRGPRRPKAGRMKGGKVKY